MPVASVACQWQPPTRYTSCRPQSDRDAARVACYKACLTYDQWYPVCAWNPDFPTLTPNGGGAGTVWPNECTAQCMAQYPTSKEWSRMVVKYPGEEVY